MFESLETFRAHVGEPTKPLEDCAICREIPASCYRFEKGGSVEKDSIPPQVKELVAFIGNDVQRCPTCHRLYLYETEYEFIYGGSEDTYEYTRCDAEALFRSIWAVRQRLPNERSIDVDAQGFF